MGMFDTILYSGKLPDGFEPPPNFDFQTKDLECFLSYYIIMEDTRLIHALHKRLIGPVYPYNGVLHFYTFCTPEGEHQYFCMVANGKCGPIFLSEYEMGEYHKTHPI